MLKLSSIISVVLFFFLGIFIGFKLSAQQAEVQKTSCQSIFEYINPRLGCGISYVIEKHGYASLKQQLEDNIGEKVDQNKVLTVSVYFRDLVNGPTFRINDDETYIPASLMKLPVLLTYLKLAEEDAGLLQSELTYTPNSDELTQAIKPKESLVAGESYTIEDLLKKMIAFSDNRSYYTLYGHLEKLSPHKNLYLETCKEIGIIPPGGAFDSTITSKSYASIYRLLYNGSYLSNDMSEKALEFLSMSQFEDGLEAGVPKDMQVAHKFGERSDLPDGLEQLHDCGIIYFPENPYLLCVMTVGTDIGNLSQTISDISARVYQEVESRKIN